MNWQRPLLFCSLLGYLVWSGIGSMQIATADEAARYYSGTDGERYGILRFSGPGKAGTGVYEYRYLQRDHRGHVVVATLKYPFESLRDGDRVRLNFSVPKVLCRAWSGRFLHDGLLVRFVTQYAAGNPAYLNLEKTPLSVVTSISRDMTSSAATSSGIVLRRPTYQNDVWIPNCTPAS